MGRSSRRGAFWQGDWFVALRLIALVLGLHQATDAVGTLERRFSDFGSTSGTRQPSDRIAVTAIDDVAVLRELPPAGPESGAAADRQESSGGKAHTGNL